MSTVPGVPALEGAGTPPTKAARHALITQILSHERIRSQAELREALARRGVSTTQATLSRDLVELRATKVRGAGGTQVYAVPEAGAPGQVSPVGGNAESLTEHTTARLARWCADLVVTAEWAGNQLVLRTPAGAAQLLASALDDAMLPGVLGCIAGDDTVLVITRSEAVAADVAAHLLSLAGPGPHG
ncbi:ArgR family transcriptional regulator [Actinomyces sp. 594]|uniref:arginine repressor n=1 Tax=Actinomyces sp. 594 TaxID=2057793 RepID=UPI001C58681A|nr:ArgR family transcriptional regulator [Actinomyces sp. 594]MBW3068679.1 ArgR family transcriptional regulator [Actinomyces sp. 594]